MQSCFMNCSLRTSCGLSQASSQSSICGRRSALFNERVNHRVPGSWYSTSRKSQKDKLGKRWKKGECRAAFPDEAPFAVAIGASILSTLVLPTNSDRETEREDSLLGPDDVISGAMQIISFIPLFNWLVWVFAWLDTRQQKYLLFAMIYLAPYLKSGLSLSPEDSWLPAASVLAGIVHVQLDLSVHARGAQSPLGDISKVLLKKAQIKDLSVQAGGIVNRLKELGEKTDVQRFDATIQDDFKSGVEWTTVEEEVKRNEFEEWDQKLSRSRAVEEPAKEETAEDTET